ncbi:unnamed protein product, partial [Scytosiphon promiscuus]
GRRVVVECGIIARSVGLRSTRVGAQSRYDCALRTSVKPVRLHGGCDDSSDFIQERKKDLPICPYSQRSSSYNFLQQQYITVVHGKEVMQHYTASSPFFSTPRQKLSAPLFV